MRILYSILLIGLFILGYFLCKANLCQVVAPEVSAAITTASNNDCRTRLVFKDGDDFNIISEENFKFRKSSSELIPPDAVLSENINLVVGYLKENPTRMMQIKGLYTGDEDAIANYKTLGHARAYAIQAFLVEQGVAEDQLMPIGKRTKQNCFEGDILQKGMSVAFGPKK